MRSESARQDDVQRDVGDRPTRGPDRTLLLGATGGFLATIVMTAFRLPISHSLPPTDEFWARYVRRDGSDGAVIPAILLHLLYGIAAGVIYVVVVPWQSNTSETRAEVRGVITAVVYSLCLSIFGRRVVLDELLGEELSPDEGFIFHLGHVVYGVTLGAWLGARTGD